MIKIDNNDLYWLAGILEGEGSFMKGPPSAPNSPVVSCNMTDLDVIEKISKIFNRTVLFSKSRNSKHKIHTIDLQLAAELLKTNSIRACARYFKVDYAAFRNRMIRKNIYKPDTYKTIC